MANALNLTEGKELLAHLPKVSWRPNTPLLQYKGYWLMPDLLKSVMTIQSQFKPLQSDIIIASFPKTGTTWLKAITASIVHHNKSSQSNASIRDDPLITHNPHELVPMLELELFGAKPQKDIQNMKSPRLYNTHLPLSLFPDSILNSRCRVIYIARNPMDTLVSCWHFFNRMHDSETSLEDAYEEFCNGVVPGGPFFDHVLEFWRERGRENFYFVTYEDLKEDPHEHVKRIAEFLGCALNFDEIKDIVWKCGHERLSNLDVNKHGKKAHFTGIEFSSFFRQGVVGDWKNQLTPKMANRLNEITKEKLEGSGLEFKALLGNI